jgi:hypothetical protein
MAQSVRDLPAELLDMIDVREWDMRTADAREYFMRKKVKKLPSIAIDGKLVFEALIPGRDALVAAIVKCVRK